MPEMGLFSRLAKRSFPHVEGTLTVRGLRAPVEVIRHCWGVPHIYAESIEDALFAQGFVHAQDRLWQMDVNRRAGQGRLSEIFGEVTLDLDRFARTVGLARGAGRARRNRSRLAGLARCVRRRRQCLDHTRTAAGRAIGTPGQFALF